MPLIHRDSISLTLYVRIRTSSTTSIAVALTTETGQAAGFYTITDAALVTAGLNTAGVFSFGIFSGTPSTTADDELRATGQIDWDGDSERTLASQTSVDLKPSLAQIVAGVWDELTAGNTTVGTFGAALTTAGASSITPVAADVVDDSRTWFFDGYKARNIIEVEDTTAGTFAMKPKLNPGTTITTVSSVTVTGAATVVATTLTVDRSRTRGHFTVPSLTTVGTYTVRMTFVTNDSQTITVTGTLKVY